MGEKRFSLYVYPYGGIRCGTNTRKSSFLVLEERIVFGDTFVNLVTSKNKKYKMEVKTTAGSAANLRLLSDGYIQMAVAQMDLTNDAYERTFLKNEKKHGGYSAVAALYTEACQVVVKCRFRNQYDRGSAG